YGPAIMTLNKAIALDPDNPLAHRYLADTLYQDGQYEKALSAFEKAARLNPKNVNVPIGMGNVYGKLNQKEKQKETYRKAVELAPADPEAHGHYAWALSNTGDFLGAMKEGFTTNSLRLKASWEPFMGMFISVWAGIFIIFGVIFSAIVSGAGFTPQSGEDLVKSFFLTMYKDKPGRFVVTSKRLVFVPELVSRSFGATRVSIQRDEISSVVVDAGKLVVSSTSGTEHVFKMPKLVLDPLIELLEKESVGKKEKQKKTGKAKKAQGGNSSESGEESKSDEKKVLAASFDFRPDASSDSIDVIAPAPVDKADSMSVADKSAKVAEESASKGREKSDSKSPTGKKTQKKSNKKAGSKSPAKKPAKKPGESPEKGGPS
ncbi:MAG: tetratricopeptide repeat protein, partial [Candidatus Obscuribacterales bacterium]|nr:tetratricopeptide repeat protein [Candidatus Obscuribacterales bacterium]